MKRYFFIIFCLAFISAHAQVSKKKIVYEYKKYEKFDFGDMSIEGSQGALGDLSVNPRYQVKFRNELPKKPNFNKEMVDSVDNLL
jgi:hypothetical protein